MSRLFRVLEIAALIGLLASASYGQASPAVSYELGVSNPARTQILTSITLPVASLACAQPSTPAPTEALTNPGHVAWDDPTVQGSDCVTETPPLDVVPDGTAYWFALRAISADYQLSDWTYSTTSFIRTGYVAPPPGPPPLVCPPGTVTRTTNDGLGGVFNYCEPIEDTPNPAPGPPPPPPDCTFGLSRSSDVVPAAASTLTLEFLPSETSCLLTITAHPQFPLAPWVTWTIGPHTINWAIAANPTVLKRYAIFIAGGQTYTLLQAGATSVVVEPSPIPDPQPPPPPPPPSYTGAYEVAVIQPSDVAEEVRLLLSSYYAQNWRVVASIHGLLILEREHK